MQSFLAYRRFGLHVRDQYERDKEKAAAMRCHVSERSISISTNSSSTATSSLPPNENTDQRDTEKGVQHNGTDSDLSGTGAVSSNHPPQPRASGLDRPGMLDRAETARTQHSMGTTLGTALTGIHVRDRTTREGGEKGRVFVVGYEGEDDSLNPHNWSFVTRWAAT